VAAKMSKEDILDKIADLAFNRDSDPTDTLMGIRILLSGHIRNKTEHIKTDVPYLRRQKE
jgi:hypothetical protein